MRTMHLARTAFLNHNGNMSAAVAQAANDLGIEPPRDHEAEELAGADYEWSKEKQRKPLHRDSYQCRDT